MAKHIIICADGTGNSTIKGRGTNVFKLYEAVDQNGHRRHADLVPQVAIYHDGVGTENLKWLRILTGATGWGLSRNVKQLYGELARVYVPGDKIFLFGFSRGAFTVRTLAGLIATCGILDLSRYGTNKAFAAGVNAAYNAYRRKYQTKLSMLIRGKVALDRDALRRQFSVAIPAFAERKLKAIEFIGVWDTVDAVGLPVVAADLLNEWIYAFKFPDDTLNDEVVHACHALALDEERESFKPILWNEKAPHPGQTIEQVWFAGVHSNVGGGYPRQGMSLVALDWMMTAAEQHGLRFIEADRTLYRLHADVDDKMYDSRAGLGVFYRWRPRDVRAVCRSRNTVPVKVHRSVFERIARNTEGYAPGALPPCPMVISTSVSPSMTKAVEEIVGHYFGGPDALPLMNREKLCLRVGYTSYVLFVCAVLTLTGLFLWGIWTNAAGRMHEGTGLPGAIVAAVGVSPLVDVLVSTVIHHPLIVLWLFGTLVAGLAVDAHLDTKYSEFWHKPRAALRNALGIGCDASQVNLVSRDTAEELSGSSLVSVR
jgi:uncharacterized protein (DUF2235 family)